MGQQDLIDINKENLYEILGVQDDATLKEINRSYRKKALKLHPDKNPDPAAHQKFLKLTQVLELLSDESSRKNYDIVLKAREAARLRTQQLDNKRRKLKEHLEDKERTAVDGSVLKTAEQKLVDMIKKLQKEGENLLQREEEKLRQECQSKSNFTATDQATLKVKWKCEKGSECIVDHSKNSLIKVLQKYGHVSDVIINPKRRGSALAIFDSIAAAKICMQRERGNEKCPLSLRMLHNIEHTENPSVFNTQKETFDAFSGTQLSAPTKSNVDKDYESITMMRLRRAEERKRLIEEIEAEESLLNDDG